jgi:hypothetical protein
MRRGGVSGRMAVMQRRSVAVVGDGAHPPPLVLVVEAPVGCSEGGVLKAQKWVFNGRCNVMRRYLISAKLGEGGGGLRPRLSFARGARCSRCT